MVIFPRKTSRLLAYTIYVRISIKGELLISAISREYYLCGEPTDPHSGDYPTDYSADYSMDYPHRLPKINNQNYI